MSKNDKNQKDLECKDSECLTQLLLDIDELTKLESRPFNVFDVLKIARTEIRHSNVLAWLLDPRENHGLGHAVLSKLNSYLVKYNIASEDPISLLTMKYSDVLVYREWMNIDILIESKEAGYVLCIENKIDTQDHSEQLNRYFEIVRKKYKDYKQKIYLYLTPEGLEPLEDKYDAWCSFDYETIVNIIEQALKKSSAKEEIEKFITSYCEILRREIMNNNYIVELCQKIYREHKVALDLIYENRPDRLQNVSEFFKKWCEKKNKEEDNFCWEKQDKEKSSKSNVRFRTHILDEAIPKGTGPSGWGTTNHYYYEISASCDKNDKVTYFIKLVFSTANLDQSEREKLENIIKGMNPDKNLKKNWQWGQVYRTKSKNVEESFELPEDIDSKNDIYDGLDDMWKSIEDSGIEEKIVDLLK